MKRARLYINGFSSVEVVLASAIFALIVTAFVGAYLYGQESGALAGHRARAILIAEEGIEAARNIRDNDFASLVDGVHGIATTSGSWGFSGLSDVFGIFTRQITVNTIDANRKSVSSVVSWQQNQQRSGSVTIISEMNNWKEIALASCDAYAVQEGYSSGICRQNSLQCTNNGETYLAGGDVYCIDSPSANTCCVVPSVTESCSGVPSVCSIFGNSSSCSAQAGCVWSSGGTSGSTTNPSFDSNTNDWIYADWDQGGGEVNVTGARSATNGNPNGWVYIDFPAGKGDQVGGYWQQSFTTDSISPSGTLSFDWQVSQYNQTPITLKLYVFVDSLSGAPTIGQQVWASGEITSTSGWVSVPSFDISSKLSTAGTYYLKVAVWVDTSGGNTNKGPYRIGYDNVQLNWTPVSSCSGTPNACDTFGDQTSCQIQSGCSWN